jgi:centrosomal protein CEP76
VRNLGPATSRARLRKEKTAFQEGETRKRRKSGRTCKRIGHQLEEKERERESQREREKERERERKRDRERERKKERDRDAQMQCQM